MISELFQPVPAQKLSENIDAANTLADVHKITQTINRITNTSTSLRILHYHATKSAAKTVGTALFDGQGAKVIALCCVVLQYVHHSTKIRKHAIRGLPVEVPSNLRPQQFCFKMRTPSICHSQYTQHPVHSVRSPLLMYRCAFHQHVHSSGSTTTRTTVQRI